VGLEIEEDKWVDRALIHKEVVDREPRPKSDLKPKEIKPS
jgi:hypothetical protein